MVMAGKDVPRRKEETALWLRAAIFHAGMRARAGQASGYSRQAGNLNFPQGDISQFLNAAKPVEDLEDIKKNRTLRRG